MFRICEKYFKIIALLFFFSACFMLNNFGSFFYEELIKAYFHTARKTSG